MSLGHELFVIFDGFIDTVIVVENGERESLRLKPHVYEKLLGEIHATLSECGDCGRGWVECACQPEPQKEATT